MAVNTETISKLPEGEQYDLLFKFVNEGNLKGTKEIMDAYNLPPNARDFQFESLLHIAALRGYSEIVEFLLQRGADVNIRDGTKHTPLHYAASDGNLECLKILLEHGADINAINEEKMILLNKRIPVYVVGGNTPLHMAAERGEFACVRMLVEKGANVNLRDNNNYTPFHLASMHSNHDIAEYLNPLPQAEDIVKITPDEFLWRWGQDYRNTAVRVANTTLGSLGKHSSNSNRLEL